MATVRGAKVVFGAGIAITSITTLLVPVVARLGFLPLIALRIACGLGEGVTYSAMFTIVPLWSPPIERSTMVLVAASGGSVGTVIGLPTAGVLSGSDFLGGWPSVFYVFGAVGLLWNVLWYFFAFSSPADDPYVSKEEREHIMQAIAAGDPNVAHARAVNDDGTAPLIPSGVAASPRASTGPRTTRRHDSVQRPHIA